MSKKTQNEAGQAVEVDAIVSLSRKMFEFKNELQWVNKARGWFESCGVPGHRHICLDAKGRVCVSGAEFMRATAEDTYPISVYEI